MSSYSFCKKLVNSIVDAVTLTYETDQLNKAAKKAFGPHIPEIAIPIGIQLVKRKDNNFLKAILPERKKTVGNPVDLKKEKERKSTYHRQKRNDIFKSNSTDNKPCKTSLIERQKN